MSLRLVPLALPALGALLVACAAEPAPAADPAPGQAAVVSEPAAPSPAAAPSAPSAPALAEPADPNEACGQVIVVSYQGAQPPVEGVTRDKDSARARASELLTQANGTAEAEFAALAKAQSDAPSSAQRGGIMGTFTKDQWPELHAALKEPLFGLKVHQTASAVVEAPYGFVVVHRCKVEKARARHVLVRYKGAKNAGPEIKRSEADARKRAAEAQQKLSQGADFAEIAKKYSEDGSKVRGGDVGLQGRGRLAPAFEQALFELKVGELSTIVQSDFGFHVIQRLPDVMPQDE